MLLADILRDRRAGLVQRLHSEPFLPQQTISQHCWNVAMLVWRLHPNPSVNMIMHALTHDNAELEVGDIPAPAKWRWESLRVGSWNAEMTVMQEMRINVGNEITDEEFEFVSMCDTLELGMYCYEQAMQSNSYAYPIGERVVGALQKMLKDEPTEAETALRAVIKDFFDFWASTTNHLWGPRNAELRNNTG